MSHIRLLFLCYLICLVPVPFLATDLYSVLGVSRSATQSEIREAYRRLARKLHPDRNPNADAEQRIMELNEAYEVLSKRKKREQYDAFGKVSDDLPRGTPREPGHFQFVHTPFADLFDFFPRQPQFSPNVVEVDFRTYRLKYLPQSRSTPLLILGVSTFCISCQRLHPLWSKVADELTPLGVVVGVTNLEHDGAMREEIRVFNVPAVVMVIDKQLVHYSQNGYSHNQLIDTLRQALLRANPSRFKFASSFMSFYAIETPLVQALHSSDAFSRNFHAGWRRDSRPRAVMCKPLKVPPLRFILAAFRAADHVAAAFVNTEESSAAEFVRLHRVPMDEETLLIFHEDPRQPVFSISAPRLSIDQMNDALQLYSQLSIPRVLSSASLLRLCSADGKSSDDVYATSSESRLHSDRRTSGHQTHRHICLLLLGHSKLANSELAGGHMDRWMAMLRAALPSVRRQLERLFTGPHVVLRLQPAYVYTDLQAAWLRRLSADLDSSLTDQQNIGRLVLLWRISSSQTAIHFLNDANLQIHPSTLLPLHSPLYPDWSPMETGNRLSAELIPVLTKLLDPLKQARSAVDYVTLNPASNWHLTLGYLLEHDVYDELAPPLWLRIRRKVWTWLVRACEWMVDLVNQPLSFVLLTGLAAIVLLVYNFIKLLWNAAAEEIKLNAHKSCSQPTRVSKPDSRPFRRVTPPTVLSLNSLTYDRLVVNAPKGHQLLVLCVRGGRSSQDHRLEANFASKTAHIATSTVQCAQLSLERYAPWLARLLEIARSGLPVRVRTSNRECCPHSPGTVYLNPANCVGTVLAVNGYRRYFSIYHPLLPGAHKPPHVLDSGSDSSTTSDVESNPMQHTPETRVRKRRVLGRLLGLESDDEMEDFDQPLMTACDKLLESELLDGLPNWLDRLFEGSLRRYTVPEWPESLRPPIADQSD